jgi:hypothetical protein
VAHELCSPPASVVSVRAVAEITSRNGGANMGKVGDRSLTPDANYRNYPTTE